MNFNEIVMARYATKKFDGKMIEESKVKKLMELIRFAPSSFNIQPWKIKVIKDKATKEKLLAASMSQQQVTTCSHLLVFCADNDLKGRIDKLESMIKSAGQLDTYGKYIEIMRGFASSMSEEQRTSWAQRQTFLALGNALNGAKSLGFDSCPMEGFDPEGYSKALNLPKNLRPTVLCPIGYAADTPNPKMRLPENEIFF